MKTPRLLFLFVVLPLLFQAVRAEGGYLFATFKGDSNLMAEQIHFALSEDGRRWTAMNEGKPVLVSSVGEKGVRDPYLVRLHDGSGFVMIATDLSVNVNGDWNRASQRGSHSLVIWESKDLVHWSAPRLAKVATEDAGCSWAPEAVYDEDAREYLVFWASTNRDLDAFAKFRIWASRTKDFRTFGAPFVYIEKPTSVIDTTILRDGETYYRFTKDEEFKAITLEKSGHLMGPWETIPEFSLAKKVGYEGPECYLVEPATKDKPAVWSLILDHYAEGKGYEPFVTTNLSRGEFAPGEGFSFPFRFRHGTVLRLSAAEWARLTAPGVAILEVK